MSRKKRLRIIQCLLLIIGASIIYLTYYYKNQENPGKEIISKKIKEEINKKSDLSEERDIFYNVEYSGLDLNGNRYLLRSEKASLEEEIPEIVKMEIVKAVFYFKDDTVLYVWSDKGTYNNKTLDMKFEKNIKAEYLNSKLFAEYAEFSNSENYLTIYENVRVDDVQGNLIADKLLFDITKQKLDITSFHNGKISANVKLNEKRF